MSCLVKCPWCGTEVPTEEYDKHYDTCPKRTKELGTVPDDIRRMVHILATNPFAPNTPEWWKWRKEILKKLAEEQG